MITEERKENTGEILEKFKGMPEPQKNFVAGYLTGIEEMKAKKRSIALLEEKSKKN